jgi:SPP1 gp7 family putative phage head morphogenesis protein
MDEDELFAVVQHLLFPPFTVPEVQAVVYASGWAQRLSAGTKLGSPSVLAGLIAHGLTAGRSQEEIARDILPAVQNVQSSARRVARTESMRVAQAAQMHAHAQLGPLVIGYTVRAVLDQNTRPAHRARDRTAYYAHPGPGQLGYDQMPNPPAEADGSIAYNCRCFLTPILRAPT